MNKATKYLRQEELSSDFDINQIQVSKSQINPKKSSFYLAYKDIKDGLKKWHIWLLLGWQDIQLRYRRSTLGPLWITLSMAITIYSMGLLYGKLFHMELRDYYPFLAAGMVTWSLISTLIIEGTNTFIEAEGFIKQMKQPYSVFIFRVVTRNFFIFFHNLLVLVPIMLIVRIPLTLNFLFIFLGLAFIWLNAVTYCSILAILGTRFRDLPQMINSLVQVIFFITPVLWSPKVLPERYLFVADLNPFAQFLEIIRNPLLGMAPSTHALIMVLLVSIVGLVLVFLLFAKVRARIVYWL